MKRIHIVDAPPLYTNTFLMIGNAGHAVAIDPAADAHVYLDTLAQHGAQLTHILLTHGHYDHVGAVEELRDATGAILIMHMADAALFEIQPDKIYANRCAIAVDDMVFEPIFAPGHTPGSVCLLCGNMLFSGDVLFAGDIGRCDLEGGDFSQMQRSLRELCEAVQTNVEVLPGHDVFTTMDEEKAHNRYLQF